MLERFLLMIQVQRQDFNGKVMTVRAHDSRAIAVESLSLYLYDAQDTLEHLKVESFARREFGNVNPKFCRGRGTWLIIFNSQRVAWQKLIDRHTVKLGKTLKARYRNRPLAPLVCAEHRCFEFFV
ncbi:MAG: hypothetical protein ACKODE_10105 [Acidimicrobiaceae bacterium]